MEYCGNNCINDYCGSSPVVRISYGLPGSDKYVVESGGKYVTMQRHNTTPGPDMRKLQF